MMPIRFWCSEFDQDDYKNHNLTLTTYIYVEYKVTFWIKSSTLNYFKLNMYNTVNEFIPEQ